MKNISGTSTIKVHEFRFSSGTHLRLNRQQRVRDAEKLIAANPEVLNWPGDKDAISIIVAEWPDEDAELMRSFFMDDQLAGFLVEVRLQRLKRGIPGALFAERGMHASFNVIAEVIE